MKQSEILHEARLDEEANTNPRTRTLSMKWVKLGEGKDPEWAKDIFLYRPDPDGDHPEYYVGFLSGIEIEKDTKVYKFMIGGEPETDITHFAIPTVPK